MRLIRSLSQYIIEYESENEYELNRMNFTLDGYLVSKVDKKPNDKIIVVYQKIEYE